MTSPWATSETLPETLPAEPFPLFKAWFDEAWAARKVPNANAMTLATADPDGRPHARIVLCKGIDEAAGTVTFFTNYNGDKGLQLAANPRAALVFHWDHFDRQVRMEGPVSFAPDADSDAYFNTRHWASRIGAWASEQSRPIADREELLGKVGEVIDRLGLDLAALADLDPADYAPHIAIPRPPHWGGYRVWAERVELWCGGKSRVHDRAVWTRPLTPAGDGFSGGAWEATRLQP